MKHRLSSLLALAFLVSGAALAQTETTPKVIPRYDVEIVIFKNLEVPKGREFILPVSLPGKADSYVDLSSASSIAAASEKGYEMLPSDEYRLIDTVAKLIESSRYQLLLHVAWRQPGLELEQVLPIWVKGGRIYGSEYTSIDSRIEFFATLPPPAPSEQPDGKVYAFDEQTLESLQIQSQEWQKRKEHRGLYELEGKITVALTRYLHVYTDLVLRRPRLSVDPQLSNSVQDAFLAETSADARILNNHRLKEHRRMRSKVLHYLDNPEFAMLVLITPYEVPEGFEEEPEEPLEPGTPATTE
jgi:hypothetical protein